MCKIYRRFYKCVEDLDNLRGNYLGDGNYVCGWDVSQITGQEEQHSRGAPAGSSAKSDGKNHCMTWIVRCSHPTTTASRILTNQPCKAALDEEFEYLDEPCPECAGEGHLPFTKKMNIPEHIAYPGNFGETWDEISEAEKEVIDAYLKGTTKLMGNWLASVGVAKGFVPIPPDHDNTHQIAVRNRVEWAVQETTCRFDARHGSHHVLYSRYGGPDLLQHYEQLVQTGAEEGPGLCIVPVTSDGCWDKRCHWISSQANWTRDEMAKDMLTTVCEDMDDHRIVVVRDPRDEVNLIIGQLYVNTILRRTEVEGMEDDVNHHAVNALAVQVEDIMIEAAPQPEVQDIVIEAELEAEVQDIVAELQDIVIENVENDDDSSDNEAENVQNEAANVDDGPKHRLLVTVPPITEEEERERRMAFWQHDFEAYMDFLGNRSMAANMHLPSRRFFLLFLLWIIIEGDQGVTPRRLRLMRWRFEVLLRDALMQCYQGPLPPPEEGELDSEFIRLAELMVWFTHYHREDEAEMDKIFNKIMSWAADNYPTQWRDRVADRWVEKRYRADHWSMARFEVATLDDARSAAASGQHCFYCWGNYRDLDIKRPVAVNGCAQWKHFLCRSCATYDSGYRENGRWPIVCGECRNESEERVTVAQPAQMTEQQRIEWQQDELEKLARLERMAEAIARGEVPDNEGYH